jgi:hypothetical protein
LLTTAPPKPGPKGGACKRPTATSLGLYPILSNGASPDLGQDDLLAQLVALVGKPGFVVNAKAAVWERQDVEVPDVHGLYVGVSQPSGFSALVREARAFEPVLFGGSSAVVGRPTVGQHGGDARATQPPSLRIG